MKKKIYLGLAAVSLQCLSGCAIFNHGLSSSTSAPGTLSPIEKPIGVTGEQGSAIDESIEALPDDLFISTSLQLSDPLPDITVKRMSFSNGSPYDLMRQLLAGTGLSFTVSSDTPFAQKRTLSAVGISGRLEDLLNSLSDTSGFYWQNKNNVISIFPERQYIAKLPPVNEIFESLPQMIKTLGANTVFLDKSARTITYRADKPSQQKINSYLEYIRANKCLIVYDTYIWEIVLNDNVNTGIQWNKFSWNGNVNNSAVSAGVVGGSTTNVANGLGFGAVYSGAHVTMDVLANFLATQGTLQTISQPKLNLISGGTAFFRNGKDTNYVSGISAPTVGPNGQTTSGASTMSTLQTGMQMTLSGDIADGTVYTGVKLVIKDLIGFLPYPAGAGQTLNLPDIANREVNTTIRALSNDTILLAGINGERVSSDVSGLPAGEKSVLFPTQNSSVKQRTELVIVLKPHVINFVQKKASKL